MRPAAYSDMTVLPDGTVGLLHETGDGDPYQTLTFLRFDLDWLTQAEVDADADGMSDYYEQVNDLDPLLSNHSANLAMSAAPIPRAAKVSRSNFL